MSTTQRSAPGAGTEGAARDRARSTSIVDQAGDKSGQAAPYQLLPALTPDEYAALCDSIRAEGIRVPIQVDEHGAILDGHHRSRIAAELGIECPRVVVSNLDTEQAKRTVALSLNLSRRHLNREQTRQVIAASLAADPDLSDREHARRCGCSPTTVGTVRRESEASKLDTHEKKINSARAGIAGMRDALVALVLNGQLRDDVELERTLRRQVPDVPGAAEQLAEVIDETADRVRGRVRTHDKPAHDERLALALARYGIDAVTPYTALLPWMTRSEFDGLIESARARGWVSEVIVTRDADDRRILVDGRCRLVASMYAGVPEVVIDERDIDDPEHFSFEVNVLRYHATPDERAERLAHYQAVVSKLDTVAQTARKASAGDPR